MAFGSFEGKGSGTHTVSEINMVPLIDVMLVLLVIFIITAPLLAHSIKINMPQVAAEQIEEEPKTVDLAIDASGALFWDEKPVNIDDLPNRFKSIAGMFDARGTIAFMPFAGPVSPGSASRHGGMSHPSPPCDVPP